MIQVLGLRHKKTKESDTNLDWLKFQEIYIMYYYIKNK